ncbi:RNase H [Carex littledalei]|uniref:RNase H n=1 Tax=Carex littledalei TaxID=544730 RepID=A0A833VDU3_9POAL|nr:RNase H [Carex littledalei]
MATKYPLPLFPSSILAHPNTMAAEYPYSPFIVTEKRVVHARWSQDRHGRSMKRTGAPSLEPSANLQNGTFEDRLTGTFQESIVYARDALSDRDFILFVSNMWANWRTRNEVVYGGKNRDFKTCKEYTRIAAKSSSVTYWCAAKHKKQISDQLNSNQQQGSSNLNSPLICFVDGSWVGEEEAGVGVYLVKEGVVVEWVSKHVLAANPCHAEAQAFLEGCQMFTRHGNGEGTVMSDSKEIIQAVNSDPPDMNDWRSFSKIWQIWVLKKEANGSLLTGFCGREEERIKMAHKLANWNRICKRDRRGVSDPLVLMEELL